jgi:hypothetical protein
MKCCEVDQAVSYRSEGVASSTILMAEVKSQLSKALIIVIDAILQRFGLHPLATNAYEPTSASRVPTL